MNGRIGSMTDQELIALVAVARMEGWYEDSPEWNVIDVALRERGYETLNA